MENESVDTLPTGITWLVDGSSRSNAPHQLVLDHLGTHPGQVLWIDARDVASTYTLYSLASSPRQLESIRIARAWTAYQHHTLVRHAVERASERTCMIVLPHVCSLYRDDDLDTCEAERLLEASLHTLDALSDALDLPVLLTAPSTERAVEQIADHELRCEVTEYGYAFRGDTFQTTVYHRATWWQTTIPYWVELLGAIRREEEEPWIASVGPAGLQPFV